MASAAVTISCQRICLRLRTESRVPGVQKTVEIFNLEVLKLCFRINTPFFFSCEFSCRLSAEATALKKKSLISHTLTSTRV